MSLINAALTAGTALVAPVSAAPVVTAGGTITGAQTVSMADSVAALTTALSTGASPAAIVNAANVNLGVSATDMARVGTTAQSTDIVAAANYANSTITAAGGLLGGAQGIAVATLQRVLTELSPAYTAAQLITVANTNWGVSEADVRTVGRSLNLPGYAAGTSAVPFDMTARIHAGEEITPRPYVDMQRASRDESNVLMARLVARNERLAAKVAALQMSIDATAKSTEKTADTLVTATRGGRAMQTEVFS